MTVIAGFTVTNTIVLYFFCYRVGPENMAYYKNITLLW